MSCATNGRNIKVDNPRCDSISDSKGPKTQIRSHQLYTVCWMEVIEFHVSIQKRKREHIKDNHQDETITHYWITSDGNRSKVDGYWPVCSHRPPSSARIEVVGLLPSGSRPRSLLFPSWLSSSSPQGLAGRRIPDILRPAFSMINANHANVRWRLAFFFYVFIPAISTAYVRQADFHLW